MLEAARQAGVRRFHHISTCEVYGDLALDASTAFTEEFPYRPRTPYNAHNYGPNRFPEKVLPLFTTRAGRRDRLDNAT